MKRIEFVILCRDRVDYLREALKSLENNLPEDVTVKISDNSTNDDVRILVQNEFPFYQYIKRVPNLKALDHFEAVIEEAALKYLVIFHDDDEISPGYFDALTKVLDKNLSVVGVASNAYVARGLEKTKKLFFVNQQPVQFIREQKALARAYLRSFSGGHPPFPSYMYRTESIKGCALKECDGGKHSDVSFLMKILKRGSLVWLTQPFMHYRVHGGNDSSTESLEDRLSIINYMHENADISRFSLDVIEYKVAYKMRIIRAIAVSKNPIFDKIIQIAKHAASITVESFLLMSLRPGVFMKFVDHFRARSFS